MRTHVHSRKTNIRFIFRSKINIKEETETEWEIEGKLNRSWQRNRIVSTFELTSNPRINYSVKANKIDRKSLNSSNIDIPFVRAEYRSSNANRMRIDWLRDMQTHNSIYSFNDTISIAPKLISTFQRFTISLFPLCPRLSAESSAFDVYWYWIINHADNNNAMKSNEWTHIGARCAVRIRLR